MVFRLIVIILYRDVYVKSMTINIAYIFLLQKYSTCIYFIGLYAFQSVFLLLFIIICSYFISGFGAGNTYYYVYYFIYFHAYTFCT